MYMNDLNHQTQKTPIGIWVLIGIVSMATIGVAYNYILIGQLGFLVSLIVAILGVLCICGLYFRVNELRQIIVFFSLIQLIYNILGALGLTVLFLAVISGDRVDGVSIWRLVLFYVPVVMNIFWIWYLTRPKIKLLFGDEDALIKQNLENPEIF